MICSSVNLFFTSNLLSSGLDFGVRRYSNPGGVDVKERPLPTAGLVAYEAV